MENLKQALKLESKPLEKQALRKARALSASAEAFGKSFTKSS